MSANFNLVAPVYDRLARLVFGNLLKETQLWQINNWPIGLAANVLLISGDGTGFMTEQLLKSQVAQRVIYVEPSAKMMKAARQRLANYQHLITFIEDDKWPADIRADAVVTNFLLDLFTETDLQQVIQNHLKALKSGGYWFAADFCAAGRKPLSMLWQPLIIKAMYLFFGVMSKLPNRQLPDIIKNLQNTRQLRLISKQSWKDDFVFSSVWQNITDFPHPML